MDKLTKKQFLGFQKELLCKDIRYRLDLMTNPNVRPDMNDVLYIINKVNEIRELNTQIETATDDIIE